MTNVLPTDNEVSLFVADDVRQELNSKVSLSGFYPGNSLNVRDIGPNIAIPLAFMLFLTGGSGKFKFKMEFFAPSGNTIFKGPETELVKDVGRNTASIAKIMGFPMSATGKFRIDIYLDGKKYSRELVVGHDPSIKLV